MLFSSPELSEGVEMTLIGTTSVSDRVSAAQFPSEVATHLNNSFKLILFHLIE